jgi:hypothetical protein
MRKQASIDSTHSARLPITIITQSPRATPQWLNVPARLAERLAISPNNHSCRCPPRLISTSAHRSGGIACTTSSAKFIGAGSLPPSDAMTFWNGVLWLHLLAMAFFVGGQLMLAAVVVPVLRSHSGTGDRGPLRAAARRFGIGTLGAVGVLVVTGAAMASHFHRWSDSTLQVKLSLVVLVGVLIAAHMRRPEWHVLDAAIFLVSLAIVWLGIVVAG